MGDLIQKADQGEFQIIVHGCNCFNVMGAGIAAAIAKRAPQAPKADHTTFKGDRRKLGTYTKSVVSDIYAKSVYTIINAYTQYTFWDVDDMLDYGAVHRVFTQLKQDFDSNTSGGEIPAIGIPLIGAGLACGDWNRIEKIIDDIGFRNLTCVVFDEEHLKKINRTIS